ncbi:MAG TPA: (d)CMP kinase [Burkholderiales bacterium]|nr:(d)CMP kinase [Burkholderiales bacterium]
MGGTADVPVIAIDGPSASGKGTVAQAVARALGFHYLDSGALYRLVALDAMRRGVDLGEDAALTAAADRLDARFFADGEVFLGDERATEAIRTEACSTAASRVAAVPGVRAALLDRQRGFRRPPGLVADGRDMGSLLFPDARLKVFLTASLEARAERRHKQLKDKGIAANIQTLLRDLEQRDARDAARVVAPLKPAPDARILDTTGLTPDEAADAVLAWYRGGN